MALPKLSVPTFELTLPLSKKQVKYRPFLVKEQKILMMANESTDRNTIVRSIQDVLHNCCLSDIKIESLPILDIEFFFLNLRARSVGEVIDLKYRCQNTINEEVCNGPVNVSVNLLEIEVSNIEEYKDTIMLDGSIGIKFKYPDFSILDTLVKNKGEDEIFSNYIINSIDYIFDGDTFYYAKETTREELVEFLESLSKSQFEMIENYLNNLPVLKKSVKTKCSKCGYEHSIDLEGVESFFE